MNMDKREPVGGIIRRVAAEDAAGIANIYNVYVTRSTASFEVEPVGVDSMRQRVEQISAHYPYWVYETGGRVVGYCYAHEWKERPAYRCTYETTVYVAEDYVGRGIGRQLMERLIDSCRLCECRVLIACITAENEASIAMHRKLGFEPVSRFREVGRKFGRWLDVVDCELLLH